MSVTFDQCIDQRDQQYSIQQERLVNTRIMLAGNLTEPHCVKAMEWLTDLVDCHYVDTSFIVGPPSTHPVVTLIFTWVSQDTTAAIQFNNDGSVLQTLCETPTRKVLNFSLNNVEKASDLEQWFLDRITYTPSRPDHLILFPKVLENWAYYDGPISGVAEIDDRKLYFACPFIDEITYERFYSFHSITRMEMLKSSILSQLISWTEWKMFRNAQHELEQRIRKKTVVANSIM